MPSDKGTIMTTSRKDEIMQLAEEAVVIAFRCGANSVGYREARNALRSAVQAMEDELAAAKQGEASEHEFRSRLTEFGLAMRWGQSEKAKVLADVLASMVTHSEDWKLVPVKMTKQMFDAFQCAASTHRVSDDKGTWHEYAWSAALAAAPTTHPAPVQEGWKPIESAPKDGSWILLGYFLEGGGGGSPEVAHWHGQRLMWCSSSRLLNSAGYYSPTHWMPLPAAPSTGEPQ